LDWKKRKKLKGKGGPDPKRRISEEERTRGKRVPLINTMRGKSSSQEKRGGGSSESIPWIEVGHPVNKVKSGKEKEKMKGKGEGGNGRLKGESDPKAEKPGLAGVPAEGRGSPNVET